MKKVVEVEMSEKVENPDNDKKAKKAYQEQSIRTSCSSYIKYIFIASKNYILFPLTVLFFVICEGFYVFYFRLLAGYDDLQAGSHGIFGSDDRLYWGIAGLAVFCFFFFAFVRYMLLYVVVLVSNEELHEEMIHGVVRSPSSFFDQTPTGELTNKFSNDLGILDNNLTFCFLDLIEGIILCLIIFGNTFAIDLFFLIPGIVCIVLMIWFFWFCKETVVEVKQLDLRLKSPLFSMVNELLSSLVQVRIFNKRDKLLNEFASLSNDSLRANLSYWGCSRIFGAYLSYMVLTIFVIGMMIGISNIQNASSETTRASLAGLYGISIIFLVQISDYLQWSLRQIVSMESIMISVERSFLLKELQPEK